MSARTRAVVIGLALAFGSTLAWRFAQKAPDIATAWGNAWAERERRLAAEDLRRAEQKREGALRLAANGDHNEAHCKITVRTSAFGDGTEVLTGVRSISPAPRMGEIIVTFGGGVERYVSRVVKTENCR